MIKHINLFFFSLAWMTVGQAQNLLHKELLGRPTSNSITVQAIFADSAEVRVEYGTISGALNNQTNWQVFEDSMPAEFILLNLNPNTKYYYRLQYRKPGVISFNSRPEFSFNTQKPINTKFTFVIQADPHLDVQSDTALYALCLRNQKEDNPDFMIDLGDVIMTDKLTNSSKKVTYDTVVSRFHLMRNYYEIISGSVPLFLALGNHEAESGWNNINAGKNMAVWNTVERKKYFLNPSPDNFYSGDTINHPYTGLRENYYSWKWGDGLFIVLDPYWYTNVKPDSLNGWRWTLGKTQYDWLKKTLESNPSKFKFVFAHQLIGGDPDGRGGVEYAHLYEWGGRNRDSTWAWETNRPGWYKPIKDLLTEHKVNIFFHGHDHFFGKQEKDCMIYQECPQPSHPNFSTVNYAATYGYFNGIILPNSGHIRMTVDGDGTKVEYVRAYLPKNETSTRHNKDVSASYYITAKNCYDSITTGSPIIWNREFSNELIFPNPFSTETKIEFNLIREEKISLFITDLKGKVVRHLLHENTLQPGKFEMYWDGKDGTGSLLPNGIYVYHFIGNQGGHSSGKLVLNHF